MPKFSIIVPIYNTEKYLHSCIDSILAQTFNDFELLLIDDGSTDSSSYICDEYAIRDCRVRVFHKDNGGVSFARNVGLKNAVGEYLAFVDSDDCVSVNWLTTYASMIQQYNYPDICFQEFKYVRTSRDFIESGNTKKNEISVYEEHFITFFENHEWELLTATCSKIIKKKLVSENNIFFEEQLSNCEDFLFFYDILLYAEKIVYSPLVGYFYRVVPNSLSRSIKPVEFQENLIFNVINHISNKKLTAGRRMLLELFINRHLKYCVYCQLSTRAMKKLLFSMGKHRVNLYGIRFKILNWLNRNMLISVAYWYMRLLVKLISFKVLQP